MTERALGILKKSRLKVNKDIVWTEMALEVLGKLRIFQVRGMYGVKKSIGHTIEVFFRNENGKNIITGTIIDKTVNRKIKNWAIK